MSLFRTFSYKKGVQMSFFVQNPKLSVFSGKMAATPHFREIPEYEICQPLLAGLGGDCAHRTKERKLAQTKSKKGDAQKIQIKQMRWFGRAVGGCCGCASPRSVPALAWVGVPTRRRARACTFQATLWRRPRSQSPRMGTTHTGVEPAS